MLWNVLFPTPRHLSGPILHHSDHHAILRIPRHTWHSTLHTTDSWKDKLEHFSKKSKPRQACRTLVLISFKGVGVTVKPEEWAPRGPWPATPRSPEEANVQWFQACAVPRCRRDLCLLSPRPSSLWLELKFQITQGMFIKKYTALKTSTNSTQWLTSSS